MSWPLQVLLLEMKKKRKQSERQKILRWTRDVKDDEDDEDDENGIIVLYIWYFLENFKEFAIC